MLPAFNSSRDRWENIPSKLRSAIEANLAIDETPLLWVLPDLDHQLHYGEALLVLSDRRLLSFEPCGEGKTNSAQEPGFRSWSITPQLSLRAKDYAGTGMLELIGPESRLHHWRFTAGKVNAAHRLALRFERLREGDVDEEEDSSEFLGSVCPSCGALLAPDQESCPECEALKAKPPIQSLSRLLGFAKPRALVILLGLALTIASTGAGLIQPYLIMKLIDNVLNPFEYHQEKNYHLLWMYLGSFFGAGVLTWLLSWARTYVLAWASERVAGDLRLKAYGHLQSLSMEYFGGKRTGDLISRVSTDTDRICYFLSVHLLDFVNDVLMISMTVITLLVINPFLAIVTVLPLPVIAYLVQMVRTRLRHGFLLSSRVWSEITSVLADTIPGIRVVKAFAQEQREIDRFQTVNKKILQANDRVNTLWSFFRATVVFLTEMGLLVVWAFGAYQVYHNGIKVGELVGFVTYISRFYLRMDSMSRMLSAVQRAGASAQRLFAILDRVPSVAEPSRPVHFERLHGEIEFREVGFHYGPRPVLQDVNLKIRPGEMIGLVGPSGSGKSTLVNLACRFYDVTDGAILVDEVDIRSYAIEEYRRHIGLVLQEPFLFYGTIAENIAYGRPEAAHQEIIAAARAARAHEFILRLPDAYDSFVGERGQLLSGGERQRISIARALLIDPRILILDEATSSVDTETEREIQLALENLIQGRTTIAIAHRLSTLRRADKLVVIERGRISEIGRHDELLKKSGTYARLYKAQLEMAHGREAAGKT